MDLNEFRHEIWMLVRILPPDRFRRWAVAAPLWALLVIAGHALPAALYLFVIAAGEFFAWRIFCTLPSSSKAMSWPVTLGMAVNNAVSATAYFAPAVILAAEPGAGYKMAAVIYLFGVFVHVVNTHAFQPAVSCLMVVPGLGLAALAVWRSFGPVEQGPPVTYALAGGILAISIVNVYLTLGRQREMRAQLLAARRDADDRLHRLEELTRHDTLTGLLNRRAFDEAAGEILRLNPDHALVMLVDLDGFKPVNDGFGHEAGDMVLRTVAARLRILAGDGGAAARFGGDEFGLCLATLRPAGIEAERLGDAVIGALTLPMRWGAQEIEIGASVGLSVACDTGATVARLSSEADQAMYRAKSLSGSRAVIYDEAELGPRAGPAERARLQAALDSGEIRPAYQPRVDLRTLRIVGFEALARWHMRPDLALLPETFLPQIKELGIVSALTDRILGEVLQDVSDLRDAGLDPGRVSVNIPEMSLATQSGRDRISALLETYPEVIDHITFEITEDVFIARSAEQIRGAIRMFRSRGVRIALDDFGTGYASFQHLRQLEFDELKIDTSFTRGIGVDRTSDIIVKGFLYIARGLGVDVVAEGVETAAQESELLRLECPMAQGYRYGRAVCIEDARALLEAGLPVAAKRA